MKREGSDCINLTRSAKPISVAMLQCWTVGVNSTLQQSTCDVIGSKDRNKSKKISREQIVHALDYMKY